MKPKKAMFTCRDVRGAALLIVLSMSLGGGCIEEFPPASRLGDHIQVLGIRAEPPAAHLGEEVALTSLVYIPSDWTHPLERLWLACVPGVGESAQACLTIVADTIFSSAGRCAEECEDDPDPEFCAQLCFAEAFQELSCDPARDQKGCLIGSSDPVTYEVPPAAFEDVDEDHYIYIFMLATALDGGLADCFEIWGDQAEAGRAISPTADCTLSLKQLTIPPEEEPIGSNPELIDLLLEGEPLAAPPGSNEVQLEGPEPSSASLKLHAVLGEAEGDAFLSWFSDCGKLSHTRTFADEPTNELTAVGTGECIVYVVLRDDRGGVVWLERTLDLRL
jgi:hypothetical protein